MGEAKRRLKVGFMANDGDKKSPLEAMGEEMAKDVLVFDLSIRYTCPKDKPFDGQFNFSGPFGRKSLCYMMLESAMLFIKDFDPQKAGQGNILIAKGFPGVPGGRG
jgi:hypothetical protein